MKTCIKNLFILPLLIAGLGLTLAGRVTAQTYTTLHSFTSSSSNGRYPAAGLILSGNSLYGTARQGASFGRGTVFKVNTDGTSFTNLHSFTAGNFISSSVYTNSDGANPYAGLILSGNTLYGTARQGGSSGNGTVFKVNTDGTGFTTLHSFIGGSGGSQPQAGLFLSGNALYGTAQNGGSSGNGMVFALNTDGTDLTTLYSFTAGAPSVGTNSDGRFPVAGLILSGNTL